MNFGSLPCFIGQLFILAGERFNIQRPKQDVDLAKGTVFIKSLLSGCSV
jgi:hypothetical protein